MPTRILIVEDEPVVLSFAQTVLTGSGHEVLTARSVPEARRILEAQPADPALCLVIDLVLDGDSGIAFAHECMAQNPAHRILLVSGFTDEVLMPELTGKMAFLRKPFSREELLEAVGSICGTGE